MLDVFISGTGRCGTNITQEILRTHSKLFGFDFEYRFAIDPDGFIEFYKTFDGVWNPYVIDRKIKRLDKLLKKVQSSSNCRSYQDWELDKHIPKFNEMTKELINELKDFSFSGEWIGSKKNETEFYFCDYDKQYLLSIFRRFLVEMIEKILNKHNAETFVEDNTWNFIYADILKKLIPDSKLIHVYRDPRDVVASLTKQRFSPQNLVASAKWYKGLMDRWFEQKKKLSTDYYLEIKLEDLVSESEKTIKSMCDFIGIEFEEKLLDIDLSKSNSGRWKDDFSSKDQEVINVMLERYIKRLGYNNY